MPQINSVILKKAVFLLQNPGPCFFLNEKGFGYIWKDGFFLGRGVLS